MTWRTFCVVLLASSGVACISYADDEHDIRAQAVHDLGCPAEKIDIELENSKNNRQYCAYGCGNSRAYVCDLTGCSPAWIDWCP
jgi:hypothetical protein